MTPARHTIGPMTRAARGGAAAILAMALVGCARVDLVSERDSQPHATLLAVTEAAPRSVGLLLAGDPPLAMEIERLGDPAASRVVIAIHGIFADRSTWRFIAGTLAEDSAVVLVDLPGCGGSEAAPRGVDPAAVYEPDALADRVADVVRDELARRPEGTRLVLMGHSLGGAIVLRLLSDPTLRAQHADIVDACDAAVLIAPLDVALAHPPPVVREFLDTADSWLAIGAELGLLWNRVALGTLRAAADESHAFREEAEKRLEILASSRRRRAMRALVLAAVPWDRDGPDALRGPSWERIEPITDGYARIDVPCLIVWGAHDEILSAAMGYRLAAQVPGARLRIVPRAKHSPHIERPDAVLRLVREFVASPDDARAALPATPAAR